MKGNYKKAVTDVNGLIDAHYPYPQHQWPTDITEVIEFPEIADEHNLSNRQYEALINRAQKYHDSK